MLVGVGESCNIQILVLSEGDPTFQICPRRTHLGRNPRKTNPFRTKPKESSGLRERERESERLVASEVGVLVKCFVLRITCEMKREKQPNMEKWNKSLEWAELVLPWLPPQDLASLSTTCKSLHQIAKSITDYRVSDTSRGLEKHSIPISNTIDKTLYPYFLYTPFPVLGLSHSSSLSQPWGKHSLSKDISPPMGLQNVDSLTMGSPGCGCGDCFLNEDGKKCGCRDFGGGLLEGGLEFGAILECGSGCNCKEECRNRVNQKGISVRLRVVKHESKGWGLHAAQLIRRGEFVCEYAGEVLTTSETKKRQLLYDELSKKGRFSHALMVVREHLPSGEACLRVNIDATRLGNVARLINHSCDGGNLSPILVRTRGRLLPRLCLFASRDVALGEELTFSYGASSSLGSKALSLCFCGSAGCLGVLPFEQT
ncbi:histone-lysine N-methyltransferase SUVR3 [Amborella trichopoda]|uniref:histone-lysine N-methyltransferase SUVR3 n=1 Tax=Amborella trichopoda TaxID=13333 RepID=UPI0009C19C5B|nr:histone-lysine N-methyltransferase SUVR3 [Amborella trichopoda]XP_011624485.2 histone-lysine N-methyltransferase SUVR3 [Amborella trichopoda]XP_020517515.1 histone-lysine N-methyltransferase SUVR3 [Amborella trichopoda]|eukprot:XP_011624457.2 histone-lysine N-methyltransferase SUVR3 [Amborella trichopoda]